MAGRSKVGQQHPQLSSHLTVVHGVGCKAEDSYYFIRWPFSELFVGNFNELSGSRFCHSYRLYNHGCAQSELSQDSGQD